MRADAMRDAALKRALTEALGSVYTDDLESGRVCADAAEARIVAWLRDRAATQADISQHVDTHLIADAIEAGEHWRADDGR